MSRVIEGCHVHFEDGQTLNQISVLFRDDGWVRVGDERPYQFWPARKIDHITGPSHRGVSSDD